MEMKRQRGDSETMGTGTGAGWWAAGRAAVRELVMSREKGTSAACSMDALSCPTSLSRRAIP